jgi:hypothetical protein
MDFFQKILPVTVLDPPVLTEHGFDEFDHGFEIDYVINKRSSNFIPKFSGADRARVKTGWADRARIKTGWADRVGFRMDFFQIFLPVTVLDRRF